MTNHPKLRTKIAQETALALLEKFGCEQIGETWVQPGRSVEGSYAWYLARERDRKGDGPNSPNG